MFAPALRSGLLSLVTLLVCSTLLCTCKKDAAKDSIVIIFASKDSQIIRAGQATAAKAGQLVAETDEIRTQQGPLDLQTRSGSSIRIKPFTTATIASIQGGDKTDTSIELQNGQLLARVQKARATDKFQVITPTAIAGVRGTTFTVETENGAKPRVRVLEGKVAMSPRVAELEKKSPEQIQADPNLKALAQTLEKRTVVLEEKSTGEIDEDIHRRLESANASVKANKTAEAKATLVPEGTNSTVVENSEKQSVKITREELTPQEMAEKETIVSVDISAVKEEKGATTAPHAEQAIQKEYNAKLDQAFTKVQTDLAAKKLKSQKELEETYKLLEVVNMKDGSKDTGAIVAQAGEILIFHSMAGVRKISKEEIAFVDMVEKK